jgi:phospholipid-binding lipoprotein MlaA
MDLTRNFQEEFIDKISIKYTKLVFTSLFCIILTACSTTSKIDDSKVIDSSDPYESINRSFYSFNNSIDQHIMRPAASTYISITPELLRIGITNFFNNVSYLNVFVNSSLQGKLDQSLSDIFRFIFNSTLGVGGLIDVATYMGLETHEEDLGQTLAVWGSGQGAYLNLPAFGPNTVRNVPDYVSDYFLNPINYLATIVSLPVSALNLINSRANLLNASNFIDSAAIDPYSFTREAYLQIRRSLIYDGNPPAESFDDIFDLEFEEDIQ